MACNGLWWPVLHGSGWLVTASGMMAACEVGCLSASSWVVVVWGMVIFYRVELSYATVLMFQSNRLSFELSFKSSCAVALAGGGAGRYGAQSGRCFFFLI